MKDGRADGDLQGPDLLRKIADATWHCGDPGMQYDTTINRWHTSRNTARINACNPCTEYMFLDDSACNLASLNLMKFAPNGTFDVEAFATPATSSSPRRKSWWTTPAIPTEAIARNSHDYRPLGLGYANLGALLMAAGLPYDSDAGRDYAASVTAIMCGEAYLQSSKIAELCPLAGGPPRALDAYSRNHAAAPVPAGTSTASRSSTSSACTAPRSTISTRSNVPRPLYEASKPPRWDEALAHGEKFGYRNAQVTVLAPTGTIGFMMDCDTTGIEPDLALVKYKKLVGGGMIKIVNNTVPAALFKLGYYQRPDQRHRQLHRRHRHHRRRARLKDEHLAVFDCSFKPAKGTRSIHYMGHLR